MLVAALILGVLTITFIIAAIKSDWDGEIWAVAAVIVAFAGLVCLIISMQINFGTKNLTGYIYSNEDRVGYTVGHIRFSENAGTDEQPSFCAPSSSKAADKIKEYSGSGKKVKVTVPPYFYFANNPFACGTDKVTVEEAK